jgi:sigma-B regulation protein RsbU (phosphoserine phosphatase)
VGDLGQVLAKNTHLPNDIVPPVLKTIISGKSTYGSFFFKWKDQEYIVSYSVPNHTQIVMVNLIKAGVAYEALTLLLDKSLFLLFIFICLAAITGILLSKHLTSALETLVKATAAIGRGQFNIRLNIRTGDEIESLGKSVKKLATDIQGLLEETKDKGRMESELLLAKEVQATLFPPQAFDSDDITLRAFSKSASECGGDWWTYFETPTDFFVIVGDATGHGVPAALLTSATNALAQLLQTIKVHAPKEMLTFMNNALHQTAHGKKSITMSLIKINKTTGLVRYANASHESPFILRNLTTTTKLSELLSLDSQKSNPLGFAPDSEYDEGEFQLQANDALLLYTDGAIDARNMENQAWGERRFAKAVIEGLVNNSSLDRSMQHFVRSFDNHTNSAPLVDDVTVILVKYKNTDTPLY